MKHEEPNTCFSAMLDPVGLKIRLKLVGGNWRCDCWWYPVVETSVLEKGKPAVEQVLAMSKFLYFSFQAGSANCEGSCFP